RFGYATRTEACDGALSSAGLVRYDAQRGERERWDDDRWLPGEAVFVPADPSAGSAEGEGWLIAYLHDRGCGPSELAIFDAERIAKGPVARVRLPRRVPFGFHG